MYDPNDPFNLKPLWPNINAPEMAIDAPLPELPNPDPTNQKFLSEAYGIGTTGPQADMATQNAQNYVAPQQPQQFGQNPSLTEGEGPLTPQQTAEAMPTTSAAMDKLIKQHMLGMPKAPTVSKDGYQNSLTAKRESEALEKEQRALRGDANRARTREKTADAWMQTLLQNHLQGGRGGGMGSPGMGSPITSGGPSVQTIGGYKFVSGHMRPQTADEAARIRMMADNSQLARDRLGLEREEIGSRERVAGKNLEFRQANEGADRAVARDRIDEMARHNRVMEERMENQLQAKLTDEEMEELEDDRFELDNIFSEMKRREGNAATKTPNGPGNGEFSRYLDTDFSKLDPDPSDPSGKKKVPRYSQGSYEIQKRRLKHLASKLNQAIKSGKYKSELPPEIALMFEDIVQP